MDRLTLLKVACKDGKANRLVKYYYITEGFKAALDTLLQEYDQEKLVIIPNIKKFLSQKQVTANSAASLRML